MAIKKKTTTKKTVAKKKVPTKRKVAAKRKAAPKKKRVAKKKSVGYAKDPVTGILLPSGTKPVETRKLAKGVEQAKSEIQTLLKGLADITEGYGVSEIELAVSFSADGKFLGVGIGGATAIKMKLTPEDSG